MPRVALEIPKVGLVMENARLVRWLKNVGDIVTEGEPLLELETEKSVVEIESTASGRLVEILMHAEQEARVGDRVGWVEVASVHAPANPTHAPASTHAPAIARVKSSPVARRLAAEHALDLRLIVGTGPRGRVQLADVRQALETRRAPAPTSAGVGGGAITAAPAAAASHSRAQPLTSMRRALARSMTLSNATVPQFNVERAVDWSTLQTVREAIIANLPAGSSRPSINDFLLQAVARTLLAFPALNATFSGDANSADARIESANGTHVGLVIAVDNGLLVPVFHNVERLGLAELARQRADTVERALNGRLRREDLEGGTFSLSNLGADGPDRFTALINPPQSAILAVGRQRDCVVANKGQIHIRPMSQLTLTVDHRIADGRLAAIFLNALVALLESDTWR